jgi:hypothetical protein
LQLAEGVPFPIEREPCLAGALGLLPHGDKKLSLHPSRRAMDRARAALAARLQRSDERGEKLLARAPPRNRLRNVKQNVKLLVSPL